MDVTYLKSYKNHTHEQTAFDNECDICISICADGSIPRFSNFKKHKKISFDGRRNELGTKALLKLYKLGYRKISFSYNFIKPIDISVFDLMVSSIVNSVTWRIDKYNIPVLKSLLKLQQANKIKKINKCLDSASKYLIKDRDSVLFIGGTLGPGGAERQMAISCNEISKNTNNKTELLLRYGINGINGFNLDRINLNNITLKEFESKLIVSDGVVQLLESISPLLIIDHDIFDELYYYIVNIYPFCPKVVYAWQDEVSIYSALASLLLGVPKIIVSTRSLAPDNFQYDRWFYRYMYRRIIGSANVTFLNNSIVGLHDYERYIGKKITYSDVIYNAIDLPDGYDKFHLRKQTRDSLSICENDFVVGSIFRISEEKQPFLYLDVCKILSKTLKNVKFIIVGSGNLAKEAERYAENIGVNVTFLGNSSDVFKYLYSFDLFMLTSRVEGLPNVLIEAQVAALPIVSSCVGGVPEVINEKSCILVPENSAQQFVDAVTNIYNNFTTFKEAALEQSAITKVRFSVDRMIKRTISHIT